VSGCYDVYSVSLTPSNPICIGCGDHVTVGVSGPSARAVPVLLSAGGSSGVVALPTNAVTVETGSNKTVPLCGLSPYDSVELRATLAGVVAATQGVTIIKVDLDIDGVEDADEETTGAVVVRRHDDNDAPRKKIILRQVEPTAWSGDVLLSRGSTKVKVFNAETGGAEITFNGTDNKFASTVLPKSLWVQGDTASAAMRDVPLDLSVDGLSDCKDSVNFTVLWVDVDKRTAGNVSDDNAGKAEYIDRTGADGFGFRIYNLAGALGVEFVGTVHPSDFDQDVVFRRKFIASKEYSNGTLRSSDLDERMDTSDADIRDDDPQSGDSEGTVYDLDAPGVLLLAENPGDTDSRRANYKQWTTYTVGAEDVRCSQERPWYLRINVKMKPGYTFELFNDVEGDNKIDFGTTSLEYNLE
jgi:hypothetical protein